MRKPMLQKIILVVLVAAAFLAEGAHSEHLVGIRR